MTFKRNSREYWKKQHKINPLYEYNELSQDEFLKKVDVSIRKIEAKHKIKDDKGYWEGKNGELLTPEGIAKEYYESLGFEVYYCERKIISTLVGAFLWTPINDPEDDRLEFFGIGSRGKYSKNKNSEILWMMLPRDFGSYEFFLRKKENFLEWIELIKSNPLIGQYDYFLECSKNLREYLWVYNTESENITRKFLEVVPDNITIKLILWGIEHFWDRQTGWPDLFLVKEKEFLFVEVKTPHDKLSPDQMNWFEWVISNKIFNCEICKIKKIK